VAAAASGPSTTFMRPWLPPHERIVSVTAPAPRETKDAPAQKETKDAPAQRETKDAPAQRETKDAPAPRETKDAPAQRETKDAARDSQRDEQQPRPSSPQAHHQATPSKNRIMSDGVESNNSNPPRQATRPPTPHPSAATPQRARNRIARDNQQPGTSSQYPQQSFNINPFPYPWPVPLSTSMSATSFHNMYPFHHSTPAAYSLSSFHISASVSAMDSGYGSFQSPLMRPSFASPAFSPFHVPSGAHPMFSSPARYLSSQFHLSFSPGMMRGFMASTPVRASGLHISQPNLPQASTSTSSSSSQPSTQTRAGPSNGPSAQGNRQGNHTHNNDRDDEETNAVDTDDEEEGNAGHNGTDNSGHNFPEAATKLLTEWFQYFLEHPYPSKVAVRWLAQEGGVTETQVRKFMANHRNRSGRTIRHPDFTHPRSLQSLREKAETDPDARHRLQQIMVKMREAQLQRFSRMAAIGQLPMYRDMPW
jgi:hypothetical protein